MIKEVDVSKMTMLGMDGPTVNWISFKKGNAKRELIILPFHLTLFCFGSMICMKRFTLKAH